VFSAGTGGFPDVAPFLNPLSILDGARQFLFGGSVAESPVGQSDVPLFVYGLATLILAALAWAILAIRYRRIAS
jgi:hypothetical protein